MRARRTIKLLAQTEICQYDMAVNSNENVLWLEITARSTMVSTISRHCKTECNSPVDDTSAMKTVESFCNLSTIEAGAVATKSAPSSQLSGQITSWVKVEDEEQVFLVLQRRAVSHQSMHCCVTQPNSN